MFGRSPDINDQNPEPNQPHSHNLCSSPFDNIFYYFNTVEKHKHRQPPQQAQETTDASTDLVELCTKSTDD